MFSLLIEWKMKQSAKEWEMWKGDSWMRWYHWAHCFFPFELVIISSKILLIHSYAACVYSQKSGLAFHLKILQRKRISTIDMLLLRTTAQLFHVCQQQKKTCWLSSPFSSVTFTWCSAKDGKKTWRLIKCSHKKRCVCVITSKWDNRSIMRCAKFIGIISVGVSRLNLDSSYSTWSHVLWRLL